MGVNPNTLSASFTAWWSRKMQQHHHKNDVYRHFASFAEKKLLKKGNTVHRPYKTKITRNAMGADGSYQRQAITDTDETLTIDKEYEASIYIRSIDEIQHNYKVRNEYARDMGVIMGNGIDGDVLANAAANAASAVDASDLGGTIGEGITPTTSNIDKILNKINLKLNRQNIPYNDRWINTSPDFFSVVLERLMGKESGLGDKIGLNAKLGFYAGFRWHITNSSYWTGRLALATNPSDGDTITINGVTLTFKATLGTTAGNVHICSTAAKTIDNLIVALEAPATTIAEAADTGYVAVSSTKDATTGLSDQDLLKELTCTDGATYLDLKANGWSYLVVSDSLTASADGWTAARQIQGLSAGQGKPTDVVVQKYPHLETKDRTGYIGKDFINWACYGINTFKQGTYQLVNVKLRSDNY